jgi:hypothetical protein
MTQFQKFTIEKLKAEFDERVNSLSGWGSSSVSSFTTYRNNNNEEDSRVLVGIVSIDGISDDGQLFMNTSNILIEEDGKYYVLEYIMPKSKIVSYLTNLTKFEWERY